MDGSRVLFLAVLSMIIVVSAAVPLASGLGLQGVEKGVSASTGYRVISPLPTMPAPVLAGSTFKAEVNVETGSSWAAWIEAPGHVYNLTVETVSQGEEGVVLELGVPENTVPELYDLHVSFEVDGTSYALESVRSVWVLDHWPEKLTIAHLTDIHIGVVSAGKQSIYHFMAEAMLINMLPVDMVVVTGDNADVGSISWHHTVFMQILNLIRKPTFVVPGNHDYQGDPQLKNYRRFVNPRNYYYVEIGPYLLMGLDSGSEGVFTSTEVNWASSILEEMGRDHTVIMMWHHPLFQATVSGSVTGDWQEGRFQVDGVKVYSDTHRPGKLKGTYRYTDGTLFYSSWMAAPDMQKEILRWATEYNVAAVFNGHVHNDGTVLYNGKTWFITGSPAGGPHWSDTPGSHHGMRIVDVYSNGTVNVWPLNGKGVFDCFNSINIDKIYAQYFSTPTGAAVRITIGQDFPDIDKLPEKPVLWIPVFNAAPGLNVYSNKQVSFERFDMSGGISWFKVTLEQGLARGDDVYVVIAPSPDEDSPSVSITRYTPLKPTPSSGVKVSIKASDPTTAVARVYLEIKLPNGEDKIIEAIPQYGGASVDGYKASRSYSAGIPPVSGLTSDKPYIEIRALAQDAAGNLASSEWKKIVFNIPTEQPNEQPGNETTQQPTGNETSQQPSGGEEQPGNETTQPPSGGEQPSTNQTGQQPSESTGTGGTGKEETGTGINYTVIIAVAIAAIVLLVVIARR